MMAPRPGPVPPFVPFHRCPACGQWTGLRARYCEQTCRPSTENAGYVVATELGEEVKPHLHCRCLTCEFEYLASIAGSAAIVEALREGTQVGAWTWTLRAPDEWQAPWKV